MNPHNDRHNARVGTLRTDQSTGRTIAPAPRSQTTQHQAAAADLIRGQLDSIYDGNSGEDTPHTTPVAVQPEPQPQQTTPKPQPQAANTRTSGHGLRTAPPQTTDSPPASQEPELSTYRRTRDNSIGARQPSKEQWQQYHSAWQKYYQMYYERQYLASAQASDQTAAPAADTPQPIGSNQATSRDETLSRQEAMKELRESIRSKVVESADKAKKSRHFVPIVAGLVVLLIFLFLQYNRVFFGAIAAYASPGSIEPQNIIINPNSDVEVGPEPKMVIPKINVEAPVVYGVGPDHASQDKAMENGIAHFSIPGANAVPGQIGNAVFAGHSSNDVFAAGNYKQIFARNERLAEGDIIYMHFEGKRYTYSVTSTEVVLPSEVSKVQLTTDKPMLTLVSCVPLGTAEKRLLVYAEQISPDPAQAEAAKQGSSAPEAANIPGRPAPSLIERIFGA